MYAIVNSGGKQIKTEVGKEIYIEKIEAEVGEKISLDKVIFISSGSNRFGKPYLKDVSVEGIVQKHGKKKKITVFKYKPKKHSHRKKGHRQLYTKVLIKKIIA